MGNKIIDFPGYNQHEPHNEPGIIDDLWDFLCNLSVAIWREGIRVMFETRLEDPGDPITGEGRKTKTNIEIGSPRFDPELSPDDDDYYDYEETQEVR